MTRRRRYFTLPAVLLACLALSGSAATREKQPMPAIRWDEQRPGCTFSRTDDGKLQYGLWTADLGLTLTVDSQELEKVHHRYEPFFGVLLAVRYRGSGTLPLTTEHISLQFVKHFEVVETSLDPDDFAQKVQNDADALDHETARQIEHHPEKKDAEEAAMRAFQKDTAELLDFITKDSLRPARLDVGNPEVSGWVLFTTDSKWIGGWKKQEVLILRVPLDGKVFEFPFTLPPKPDDKMLRRRE